MHSNENDNLNLKNGTGVCFGDSGGGFYVKISGSYRLKGVVSISPLTKTKTCDVKKSTFYIDAQEFSEWINQETMPHNKISVKDACTASRFYCETFNCQPLRRRSSRLRLFEAQDGELPEIVGLGYFNPMNRFFDIKCRGVLISEKFVLTAAICADSRTLRIVRLKLVKFSN